MIEAVIFVVFPFAMVFAAVSDMVSMTIANRVSVILVATFMIIAPLVGLSWPQYGMHLAAGAALLTITFALFSFGAMGGGDAKLISATAVWMGFGDALLQYLIVSTIIGGVLTVAIVLYRNSQLPIVAGDIDFLRRISDKSEGIPYGIALGLGGLLIYPASPLVQLVIAGLPY